MLCEYGCNLEATYQLKNKKWCCSDNCNKCEAAKKRNSESVKKVTKGRCWYKEKGLPSPRKGKGSWNKGLNKKNNSIVQKISFNIKEYYKTHKGTFCGLTHTIESRQKIRDKKLEFYQNGGQVKCGRAPKLRYVTRNNIEIKVDGNWELAVAKYLDSYNYHWKRNTKRFPYINIHGKYSTYCPDFWVDELSSYLEIKGYKTDLDLCKWKQFTESLIIWDYTKLIEMKIIDKSGNPIN